MFQTSYFGSKAPKGRKVCIAKWNRFWTGARAPKLAPSNPKAENWQEAYLADLEERFPGGEGLAEYLADIAAKTPEPILCCYEKDPADCHRSVLAEFVKKHLGICMPEWQAPGSLSLLHSEKNDNYMK